MSMMILPIIKNMEQLSKVLYRACSEAECDSVERCSECALDSVSNFKQFLEEAKNDE